MNRRSGANRAALRAPSMTPLLILSWPIARRLPQVIDINWTFLQLDLDLFLDPTHPHFHKTYTVLTISYPFSPFNNKHTVYTVVSWFLKFIEHVSNVLILYCFLTYPSQQSLVLVRSALCSVVCVPADPSCCAISLYLTVVFNQDCLIFSQF